MPNNNTLSSDIARLEGAVSQLKLHVGSLSADEHNRIWYEVQQFQRGIMFALSRRIA